MQWLVYLVVIMGLLAGLKGWIPQSVQPCLNSFITYGVCILVFSVGVNIGRNRDTWRQMKELGLKILFIPLSVIVGTFLGSMAVPLFIPFGFRESLAIGAGFGWYSLSGVIAMQLHSAELGALTFTANLFREILSLLIIPILARYAGFLTVIAPGGATTMDTTLPMISRFSKSDITILAFINGLFLSLLVPLLVPFIIG